MTAVKPLRLRLPTAIPKQRMSNQHLLYEDDVIEGVVNHLEQRGWRVVSTASARTKQRGLDILATKDGATLAVEAKGATSSDPNSARHDQEFDKGQKRSHISVALYKVASVVSAGKHQAAIALPSDDEHRELIANIAPALEALNVAVFLVNDDLTVIEP